MGTIREIEALSGIVKELKIIRAKYGNLFGLNTDPKMVKKYKRKFHSANDEIKRVEILKLKMKQEFINQQ